MNSPGILLVIGIILLPGCLAGPDYQRPHLQLPQSHAGYATGKTAGTNTRLGESQQFLNDKPLKIRWWESFGSPTLNTLAEDSLRTNPNLEAARAALHTAVESFHAQKAGLYPNVAINAIPSNQQTAGVLQSNLASNQYIYPLYTGQVLVSYTADAFGGIRRLSESAAANARAKGFLMEATRLALIANVVYSAIQEASLREQIITTRQMIRNQEKLVAIYRKRLALGDAALLDLTTREAALAGTKAMLPPLEIQLNIQRNTLNTLAGRFPGDARTPEFTLDSLHLPVEVPMSLPSTLLENRPDIRAAEEQMHAANALIGVAIANRLPNISLGLTNAGLAATSLGNLFSSSAHFWGLAGVITQPVFAGGKLKHQQRAAESQYAETAALYRATIINAFQNVSDALQALQGDAQLLNAAHAAEVAATKNFEIARHQLLAGNDSSLALLVSEQTLLGAKMDRITAQTNRLADTVALFQALGGSWRNLDPQAATASGHFQQNLQAHNQKTIRENPTST